MSHFGIRYYNNAKSWMRQDIFARIINKFFYYTQFTLKRPHDILLTDNFSAHIPPPEWKEVALKGGLRGFKRKGNTIVFLPPNTTSVIQPLDMGVIQAFKAHYRRQHLRWMVDELDEGKDAEKIKVDLRQVCLWSREARQFILGETISNCWHHAKILPPSLDVETLHYRSVAKAKGKFKEVYDELEGLFRQLDLGEDSTDEIMVPEIEDISDDSSPACNEPTVDNNTVERGELENEDRGGEVESGADSETELTRVEPKPISLREAKKAVVDLHNFLLSNLDQRLAKDVEHQAYKVKEAVCKMVRASTHEQKKIESYYTPLNQSEQID